MKECSEKIGVQPPEIFVSVPLRGIGYERKCSNPGDTWYTVQIVSVPLRGIGYERQSTTGKPCLVIKEFQSPCGELVMKVLLFTIISGIFGANGFSPLAGNWL